MSSQYYDAGRPVTVTPASIEIEGDLAEFSRPTMTPMLFVAFRIFTLTAGRFPALSRWLKARLVKTLIYRRRAVAIRFRRRIEFSEVGLRVRDHLAGATAIDELRREATFTTIHMGSSRYFIANELTELPPADRVDPNAVPRGVDLERTITVSGGG